jgi:hypothetical protein
LLLIELAAAEEEEEFAIVARTAADKPDDKKDELEDEGTRGRDEEELVLVGVDTVSEAAIGLTLKIGDCVDDIFAKAKGDIVQLPAHDQEIYFCDKFSLLERGDWHQVQ